MSKIVESVISDNELHVYINLLNSYKLIKNNNYEEVIYQLKTNFNIDISINELKNYYNPTVNEVIEDNRLLHKSLGYYVEDGDYN